MSGPSGEADVKPAEAFLRAVIEAPDDDLVRLVYADWLEENGDAARAEFIRIGCELEKLPSEAPRRQELQRRENELRAAHQATWLGELPAVVREFRILFRRGFPGHADCSVSQFLRGAGELFWATPIQEVWLNEWRGRGPWAQLAACPELTRLRELDLRNCRPKLRDLRALLASPHLGSLVTLRFSPCGMGDGFANAFLGFRAPASLKALDLRGNRDRFTESGRRRLRDHFGDRVLLPP